MSLMQVDFFLFYLVRAHLKMAYQGLLNLATAQLAPKSWERACIDRLNSSSSFDFTSGLVNGDGKPMSHFTNATWGIGFETCLDQCNDKQISFVSRHAQMKEQLLTLGRFSTFSRSRLQ